MVVDDAKGKRGERIFPAGDGPPAFGDVSLTREQWAFLATFSQNYVAGRRFMCYGARAIVAIGVILTALTAATQFYHLIWK